MRYNFAAGVSLEAEQTGIALDESAELCAILPNQF